MIRHYLEASLREKFPGRAFEFLQGNDPFAILETPWPPLGRLEISDDDDEATVYLTEVAHGHFGCYDDNLSLDQKEQRIAQDVVNFLSALFADRVVIQRHFGGFIAGWRVLKDNEKLPLPSITRSQCVWSGPIKYD